MGTAQHLAIAIVCCFCSLESVIGAISIPDIRFEPSAIANFPEDTSVGTELFNITATYGGNINFSIVGEETSRLVRLESVGSTGNNKWIAHVILNAILDADKVTGARVLQFEISYGSESLPATARLFVTDVNDNPPMITNLPQRIQLPEIKSKVGTSVYTVKASDPDQGPGGTILYFMEAQGQETSAEYNTTFLILDSELGNITLNRTLDYEETNFYQYKVFVKDRGNPQCPGPNCPCNITEPDVKCDGVPAEFAVIVTDVQDTPPQFLRLPYILQVYENTSINSSIFQVSAMDGDRGVPNEVNYTIVRDPPGAVYPFAIDAKSGELTVVAPGLDADRDGGRSYLITVMAQEIEEPGQEQFGDTNATTQMFITVLDVNDNGPQFPQDVYYATVPENTPRGVAITVNGTITVTDIDQNDNSKFYLSLEYDGDQYNAFTTLPAPKQEIPGTSTVVVSVNNSSVLDYETIHNITFRITAKEVHGPHENSTTVIVFIQDMNDNSPEFSENQTTEFNVTEHDPVGTPVATFTATDADSGSYGTVSYSLEDTLGNKFAIDPQNGTLTVDAILDRDQGETRHFLVVVATDNIDGDESQQRSTRLRITVNVLDINDNDPQFLKHPSRVTVQEDAAVNTTILTLSANDADEGLNAEIEYSVSTIEPDTHLQAPLFGMGKTTGTIFVSASLISRTGEYNVTFMASDKGDIPRNSTTSVLVDVLDVNMNEPIFVEPDEHLFNASSGLIPNVTVKEEEPVGSWIMTINATDKDKGENGQVYYFLYQDVSANFRYFHVNSTTGKLTNSARLDRDTMTGDYYQINLQAQDRGKPPRPSNVIPLKVIVLDIDDNPPEFPRSISFSPLHVPEQTKDVVVGMVNVSTDRDSDPDMRIACYYLYGGEKVTAFSLKKTTGELRLLVKLDRNVTRQVEIVVKVTRNCALAPDYYLSDDSIDNSYNVSDLSLLLVKVEVDDINNNPPKLDREALTVGMLYDTEVGTEVINLAKFTSDDDDNPDNRINYYRLLREFPDPANNRGRTFAVSGNGSVTTRRMVGVSDAQQFVLTVQAYDRDNLTDTANLTIYLVSDNQRIKLVFNRQPNDVQRIRGEFTTKLGKALNLEVISDKISTHLTPDGSPDPTRTDLYIHARYIPSGKIVPASELWSSIDYNIGVRSVFLDFGVFESAPVIQPEPTDDNKDMEKAFIVVAGVLGITCLVLFIVLFNTRRRYRRKLRAETTSAYVTSKDGNAGLIPPGTNQYITSENPLFGQDLKSVDADRISNSDSSDSLDDNAVVGTPAVSNPGMEADEEQEMYMDINEDEVKDVVRVNRLAMVLQEYEKAEGFGDEPATAPPPPYFPSDNHFTPFPVGEHFKTDSGFGDDLGNLQHTEI